MKVPSCDEITHLLKTTREIAELSSASRKLAYGNMTYIVRHSKDIIRIMRGSCSHAVTLFLW